MKWEGSKRQEGIARRCGGSSKDAQENLLVVTRIRNTGQRVDLSGRIAMLSLGCIEMPTIQMKTKQNTLSLEESLTLEMENSILQKVMIFSLEKAQITKGDNKEKERGDRQALGGDV